jgi:hypothetical protein
MYFYTIFIIRIIRIKYSKAELKLFSTMLVRLLYLNQTLHSIYIPVMLGRITVTST